MLQALDYELKQVITFGDVSYTYERLMFQEIKKLENSFLDNCNYKALKYQG